MSTPTTLCPECDRWLRIDSFNGMNYCGTPECSRRGIYLTQEEIRTIQNQRNEAWQ